MWSLFGMVIVYRCCDVCGALRCAYSHFKPRSTYFINTYLTQYTTAHVSLTCTPPLIGPAGHTIKLITKAIAACLYISSATMQTHLYKAQTLSLLGGVGIFILLAATLYMLQAYHDCCQNVGIRGSVMQPNTYCCMR